MQPQLVKSALAWLGLTCLGIFLCYFFLDRAIALSIDRFGLPWPCLFEILTHIAKAIIAASLVFLTYYATL